MSARGARPIAFAVTTLAIALTGCGGADGASSSHAKPAEAEAAPGVAVAPKSEPRAAAPATTPAVTAPGATTVQRWPRTLQIGLIDSEDRAAALRKRAPYGIRWHYLSGGAGTDSSWAHWRTGGGSFATAFARDSRANGTIPFFSYYVLQQTPPVAKLKDEQDKVVRGLADKQVVRKVVTDIRLALRRIGEAGQGPAVLQVEPDLWGYVQQRFGDDANRVRVRLRGSDPAAKGLPETLPGFARLITRIRNAEAPSTLLAYPVSIFGTNKDIIGSQPDEAELDRMADSSVRFWRSAGRPWDVLTFEYANRNAGYAIHVDGLPRADVWWTPSDYQRHLRYVSDVLRATKRPGMLWQVPPGNTVSPTMDNSPGHYQDDKVQTLLGTSGRPLLRRFRDAGIVGVLFGSAFPNDTCACARTDDFALPGGSEDDGGYLAAQVRRYADPAPLTVRRVPKRLP